MASLKLTALNKVYPSGEKALYNVNLETTDREFLIVYGGEASGKSTLLRLIAGLEDPTEGEIFIDGKDMTDVIPKDRNLAMVFRGDTLYPALSVFDNLAFGLKQRNAPQALIKERVKAVSEILGLNDVLYRKPKQLTSATRQRVAIGRALAREPKLYLFDEPLNGLDDVLRRDMLDVIINLQARMEGSFIYATKNLSEAMTAATRILVLKNGLVQQIDTPANLYDYPVNAYVAFLMGAPTINFVQKAKIQKSEYGYKAVCGNFEIPLAENIVSRFENIDEYVGAEKEVIVGIRPEDAFAGKEGTFKGTVGKVENDGDNVYCEFNLDGGISLIVGGQSQLKCGETAHLNVDLSRVYLFDGVTRLTLLKRDEGYVKTGYADADFVPLTFEEERGLTEKLPPRKDKKKK